MGKPAKTAVVKRKKKDPAAPKGKRGAYIFFCNDIRARITEENKDLKMTELSKLMGLEWKKLDDEVKQKYKEMAQKDNERYAKEMENYTPPATDVADESTGKEENESSKTTKAKATKAKTTKAKTTKAK